METKAHPLLANRHTDAYAIGSDMTRPVVTAYKAVLAY